MLLLGLDSILSHTILPTHTFLLTHTSHTPRLLSGQVDRTGRPALRSGDHRGAREVDILPVPLLLNDDVTKVHGVVTIVTITTI